MSILETDIVLIGKHNSAIEPTGEQTPRGVELPRFDYLQWVSERYDAGEKVHDEIIVSYQGMQATWNYAMKNGDFSHLSDDFFDSLAAIEILIQRERVLERYINVFGEEPKPILNLEN